MMTSTCARCRQAKNNYADQYCETCQNFEAEFRTALQKEQPEITSDELLYVTKQKMLSTGAHARSNYIDPRNFSRSVKFPPSS